MEFASVGLLLVTIIGWGLLGFLQKVGVSKIGAESTILLSFFTTLLVSIIYLTFIRKLPIPKSELMIYPILGGISAAIGTTAFFTAMEEARAL